MNESMMELPILMIINFIELVMIYYFSHNLIEKKVKLSLKKSLIGVLYGVIKGMLAYNVVGYSYKIIVTIIDMSIFKLITKKKIHDLLIIYALMFLCVTVIQFPTLLIIKDLFSNQTFTFLVTQMITLIFFKLVILKVPLYRIIFIIEKEVLIKLFIFTMTGLILIVLFYINFDFTNGRPYILYLTILVIITFIGLYETLKRVFFYTNRIPMVLHDVKNMLLGIHITAHSTSDVIKIRNSLDQCLSLINIDTQLEKVRVNEYKENILSFIEFKKSETKREVNFLIDIQYYEDHKSISLSIIIYILGILLDNAIESATKKVIGIELFVVEDYLQISVSNEYHRNEMENIEKMFQQGYSTKPSTTPCRGYGLSNLSKSVKGFKGDIGVEINYNKEQKSDYLTMTVSVSH